MPATPALSLTSRRRKGQTVITAVGSIAQATVIQLRTLLLQLLCRQDGSLLLDLSGVEHIDDAGVDALRRTAARAHLVGGQLRLVAPSPGVAERLRGSDLRAHMTVDTALASDMAPAAPGVENPPADWLEQHQPADPAEDEAAEDDLDRAAAGGPSVEADAADLVDQRIPAPVGEEDYPTSV